MAGFTAKDVQRLRQLTGVGMLDAKRALEEGGGDMDKATVWLREQGLASTAKRADREASEGAVAIGRSGDAAAIVQLRSETDFVAKSDQFVEMVTSLADLVAAEGESAIEQRAEELERMKATLQENISVGTVVRIEAPADGVVDSYLHQQSGRGVNAVVVALVGRNARSSPTTSPRTSRSHARATSRVTRCPRRRSPRSARRSSASPATRASRRPRSERSSRVGSTAGTRNESFSTRPSSRTRRRPSPRCSGRPRSPEFAQVVVGD